MTKAFWAGAALLVACGGADGGAVFDDSGPMGSGGHSGARALAAGASSQAGMATGEAGASVAGTGPVGGGGAIAGQSGATTAAGIDSGGMVSTGGGGTAATEAGASGAAQSGNGGVVSAGGSQQGGKGGQAGSAAGGSTTLSCTPDTLDCDGKSANGCETYLCDRNHCGACGKKCFSSEQCVCKGDAPNFLFYCGTP